VNRWEIARIQERQSKKTVTWIDLFQGESNGRKDETLMGAGMECGGHLATLLLRRWKQRNVGGKHLPEYMTSHLRGQ
jgi:hypothetical protein